MLKIELKDTFLAPRQRKNIEVTLPAVLKQCEETGRLDAFKLNWTPDCGREAPHVFWDSDVAKVVEGMARVAAESPEMASRLEAIVPLIVSAQQSDGYLNTHFSVTEQDKRWSRLAFNHELYCAGHLTEAAVAHFEATGKREFLDAMRRYCDYICEYFGENGNQGYPGHEEIELALVKLYRATGDGKYLNQAKLFIDRRGTEPNYFAEKEGVSTGWLKNLQAHKPVREQTEAVGHSVRALYLYSGMADVAKETGDAELLAVCERLFDDIVENKIFITGGVGSQEIGEAIGNAEDLVYERSYAESCAAIAMILFASRMLQITGKAKYADAIERTLYNCALAGISLDGDKFFYANPHSSHRTQRSEAHISTTRQPWHTCSCCPTNYARFLPQLGSFCYRADGENVYIDISAAGRIEGDGLVLEIVSDYPFSGKVVVKCVSGGGRLNVRVPRWCRNYEVPECGIVEEGYWRGSIVVGQDVCFYFDMPVDVVFSRIPSLAGKAALCRGPLVYCVEMSTKSEMSPFELILSPSSEFTLEGVEGLTEGCVGIRFTAMRQRKPSRLYSVEKRQLEHASAVAIPYALWQNRGDAEMTIFIPYK